MHIIAMLMTQAALSNLNFPGERINHRRKPAGRCRGAQVNQGSHVNQQVDFQAEYGNTYDLLIHESS